jgi:hypothetical protein
MILCAIIKIIHRYKLICNSITFITSFVKVGHLVETTHTHKRTNMPRPRMRSCFIPFRKEGKGLSEISHDRQRVGVKIYLHSFLTLALFNITSRPLYTQERTIVHVVQEAGWAPKQVRMGVKRKYFSSKNSTLK